VYHPEDILSELKKASDSDPEALVLAERELYRSSLFITAKYLLNYGQVNLGTHHDAISVLEDDSLMKLVVMPRGTFKTSLAVVGYSIWSLIRNPNLRE
jgi:hypothetical protein